jgi:hypothetical protein
MIQILFILFSVSVFADEVAVCKKFTAEILKPAITEVKDSPNFGSFRFEKDEAKALKFLNSYDPKKLAIQDFVDKGQKEMTDCQFMLKKNDGNEYCNEGKHTNFVFMRGLIYGMKTYGWKPQTIDLAKKKIFEYLKATTIKGLPVLDFAIAFHVLEEYLFNFPEKNIDSKVVRNTIVEIEETIKELNSEMKKRDIKTCEAQQEFMKFERDRAEKFRNLLSELIQKR